MTKNIKKSLVLMFVAGFFAAVSLMTAFVSVADAKIEHFEDGSGRITYCVPLSDCQ